MSSFSAYASHHSGSKTGSKQNVVGSTTPPQREPTPPHHHPSGMGSSQSHIYSLDYANGSSDKTHLQPSNHPSRGPSPTMAFSNIPLAQLTRAKQFRLRVMRMATVPRLRLLWALLALFGSMSWMALLPAYTFWSNVFAMPYVNPTYTFFLVATVCTSLSAIWQSLCPFIIRQSQRSLLPRIINHPWTQTATIIISVLLTILNFFAWIILASGKDGAKTDCTSPFPKLAVYDSFSVQCKGVNTAIVMDAIVFLLWMPIAIVIVCGTIERGLWWWGEDDGAHAQAIVRGHNMMSEEEFDRKIGLGNARARANAANNADEENGGGNQMEYIQQPKPAFVTPISSQFRRGNNNVEQEEEEMYGEQAPSNYRRHRRQQRNHRQHHQEEGSGGAGGEQIPHRSKLQRRNSNSSLAPSLSSRLSVFFGQGWNSGPMPPPEEAAPPMPNMPSQYRKDSSSMNGGPTAVGATRHQKKEEEPQPVSHHGDSLSTQWHSRRNDDWD